MKKKFLVFAAIVVVLVSIACLSVSAAEVASGTCGAEGDNLTWVLDDTGTLTISGEGAMTDWTSSSNAPWYSYISLIKTVVIEDGVTSIGKMAFYHCDSLTSVTIGNSVTSIGGFAFNGCTSLASVTIPDSVTSIGYSAFYNTIDYSNTDNWNDGVLYIGNHLIEAKTSLSGNYTIKSGTRVIADEAFSNCTSLTWVTIPDSVTSIGGGAFSRCTSLIAINVRDENNYFADIGGVLFDKEIATFVCYPAGKEATSYTIPDSVTSISDYAFSNCSSLISVTIPDGVTSIGNSAFSGCSSLISVTIPDGVTSIGNSTFYNCYSLTNVTIPDGVTSIGNSTFFMCESLTSITIPDSVTSIGDSAFLWCRGLSSVTIGNGVISIGNSAFEDCRIISVTIPDSVTSIGAGAFYYCSLEYIDVSDGNQNYTSIDGVLFSKDGTNLIQYPTANTATSYIIPNSVTSIGNSAFSMCYYLTNVTIPDSVTSIGNCAFEYCGSLISVTIPDNVTSIGEGAFGHCVSLINVTIPDSVTSIGNYAFSFCSKLNSIIFDGTDAEWEAITKRTGWDNGTGGDDGYELKCLKMCNIVFCNYDGNVISNTRYVIGDTITVPADPTKASDNTYTYTFAGWDKDVVTVCDGDATYTATYTPTYIEYRVVFKNYDNTIISLKNYHYGDAVTAPADPTRTATDRYTYTFAGWDPEVAATCEKSVTYTAMYFETERIYVKGIGMSIRPESGDYSAGLRFGAIFNKADVGIEGTYAYEGADITFGMLIIPEFVMTNAGYETVREYYENCDAQLTLDVPAKKIYAQNEETVTYTAVLLDIPDESYCDTICALPYMIKNGEYYFGEEMRASFYDVAVAARETEYSDEKIAAIVDEEKKAAAQAMANALDKIIAIGKKSEDHDTLVPWPDNWN